MVLRFMEQVNETDWLTAVVIPGRVKKSARSAA
jgi:hypothetical protein